MIGVESDTGSGRDEPPHYFTKGDLTFRRRGRRGGSVGDRDPAVTKLRRIPHVITMVAPAGSQFNAASAPSSEVSPLQSPACSKTGMYDYDNSTPDAPPGAQDFAVRGAVTGVEVRLAIRSAPASRASGSKSMLGYPYRPLDWQSRTARCSPRSAREAGDGLVVFLICVVAAFNVVGTLTMVVRDKTREIGILLAWGCSALASGVSSSYKASSRAGRHRARRGPGLIAAPWSIAGI